MSFFPVLCVIFRANPATCRSFLTLMDVAYHLNFGASTSMTLQYSPRPMPPRPRISWGWLGSESVTSRDVVYG